MREAFWVGFFKHALDKNTGQDQLLGMWAENIEEGDKKKQKPQERLKLDPVVIAQSFTPDTYWRSWP